MAKGVLYITGYTTDGYPLLGGVWTLWHQDGFPLEMSHLICRESNIQIDWLEAMADASRTYNLHTIVKAIEDFLPTDMMTYLKWGFMQVFKDHKNYELVVEQKRANGEKVTESFQKLEALLDDVKEKTKIVDQAINALPQNI